MTFEVKPSIVSNPKGLNSAEFVIEPLPQGYGFTLGNALRRVLLTSLEGAAITEIKIDGARHEFTTLPGMKEDIVDLVLNLKTIRVQLEGKETAVVTVDRTGPGEVTGAGIVCGTGAKVLNPDQYITTLSDKKSKLKMELTIKRGKGYIVAEEQEIDALGVIPIDSIFTPVVDVNYKVSDTRVGGETNFDKLQLVVTTTGEVTPEEALHKASDILKEYFNFIINPEVVDSMDFGEEKVEAVVADSEILIEELDLPMRVVNSLTTSGIKTISDLTEKTEKEVSQIKNLGAKSIKEIIAKLQEMGLSLKD